RIWAGVIGPELAGVTLGFPPRLAPDAMAEPPSITKLGVANEALSSRRSSRDSKIPAQAACGH
ncbi:MAG TPA: hypothetical protein VGP63_00840, partial [Planctomycetaceae bacterium]|nr:hypothetical protein [Planctomycetaceae bacterium]